MINAMTPSEISRVEVLESKLLDQPQDDVVTWHLFHAGMYSRTVKIKAGSVVCGALIKRATLLIVAGDASVTMNEGVTRVTGYKVIPAKAHRKQAFYAHVDTWLTMIFPTAAKTVEEAEKEFTDEYAKLLSKNAFNVVEMEPIS